MVGWARRTSLGEPTISLTTRSGRWRILITFVLVIVLAISVFLVVRQAKPSGAAAAYVSLVSGSTGIALGWDMFANSGDLKRRE